MRPTLVLRQTYKTLGASEINREVGKLSGWTLSKDQKAITRDLKFKGFNSAWAFCTQIAMHSHLKNHHPRIENEYTRVRLTLTTHDRDSLTDADLKMAASFDRIAKKYL